LNGIDDLRLVSASVDTDEATVVLATRDGATHPVALRAERLVPPRAVSCRADELEEPLHWRIP
jgi:hypothetical protein